MKKRILAALLAAAALRVAALTGLDETAAGLLTGASGESPPESSQSQQTAAPDDDVNAILTTRSRTPSPAPTTTPTPTPEPLSLTPTPGSIPELRNDTGYDIDAEALLDEGLNLRLPAEGPQILIIHTHGSEAYTPDTFDRYTETDESRTEDKRHNVVRVGDELAALLEGYGLNVLHDRELYDYPSYNGSYGRSAEAISAYLELYPDVAIVLDLHRDAIGTGDVVYKTRTGLGGVSCAQLMFVVGTGENGLSHPDWRENLKLALRLQQAMDERYPTLTRPVAVKKERYNQQLTHGSLILEVGSSGNTLQEALTAIRLFSESAGPLLRALSQ